jgi:hypothetical protein
MRLCLVDDNNVLRESIVFDSECGFVVTYGSIRRMTESQYYNEVNNMCHLIDTYGSFYLCLRFLSDAFNEETALQEVADRTCQ